MWKVVFVVVIFISFLGAVFLYRESQTPAYQFFDNMSDTPTVKNDSDRRVVTTVPHVVPYASSSYSSHTSRFESDLHPDYVRIDPNLGSDWTSLFTSRQSQKNLLKAGQILYKANCAVCHGASGDGKGALAQYPEYPVIGEFWSEKYNQYPIDKMYRSIAQGQGNMPAFGNRLTPLEIWGMILYIQHIQHQHRQ